MEYIVIGSIAVILAFVLVKAFWSPPKPDPNSQPGNNPDYMP